MTIRILLILLTMIAAPAFARDEAALRACLKANAAEAELVQDITIDQTDAGGGVRRLAGIWYWERKDGGQRAVLKLTAPDDLAGTAYLLQRDGKGREMLHMYLPAVGKARQVTGASIAQSLFGSGLSAFDLKFLMGGLQGGSFTALGATNLAGRAAERWRYVPPPDPLGLYDRVDLVIDNAWCLPLRSELFGGVPWKTLTLDAASVRENGGQWFASRAMLDDVRDGSHAQITLRNLTAEALSERLFKPDRFYRQTP